MLSMGDIYSFYPCITYIAEKIGVNVYNRTILSLAYSSKPGDLWEYGVVGWGRHIGGLAYFETKCK